MPFGFGLCIIVEVPQKTQRIFQRWQSCFKHVFSTYLIDEGIVLFPWQTALLKRFPASTWAGSMIIQGDMLWLDHGLEDMRNP